jgi:3-isopropylmalate/(R)-2-methylmalate dehydratase small subunit
LKCVTFDELGLHVFEDDRKACREKGEKHPFDNDVYKGAKILFVNRNFGCGSSREHAPQSLMRAGIHAVVGESFAEIFFDNCVSLGIPCAVTSAESMQRLLSPAEKKPAEEWTLDIRKERISGPISENVNIGEGPRSEFLAGTWNPLQGLMESKSEIQKIARTLPYLTEFKD